VRAVFDTNILISGMLWRGAPYRCLLASRAGLVDLILSPPILEELRKVLVAKFRHSEAQADEALAVIHQTATVVDIPGRLQVVKDDPEDDKFLETAQAGGARYVVSGDQHLLAIGTYAGIPVVSARAFLDILGRETD
jgi:putative PIN family toxin of toxin-antitoxin system